MNQWIQFITWSSLQLLKELLKEAARTGKSVEELIASAEEQTNLNDTTIQELLKRLQS